jgi:hypothetical protein
MDVCCVDKFHSGPLRRHFRRRLHKTICVRQFNLLALSSQFEHWIPQLNSFSSPQCDLIIIAGHSMRPASGLNTAAATWHSMIA